jgi:signal transduction histidine kinase
VRTLSLRMRLTVWYTFALLVVLSLFGADVLWEQRRVGMRRVDRELEAFGGTLENVVRDELHEMPGPAEAAKEAGSVITAPGRAIAILDAHGTPLMTRWNGLVLGAPLPTAASPASVRTVQTSFGEWRVHSRPATFDATILVLVTATPLTDVKREQREVQEAMVVGIPIVLLLAAAGGLWIASIGLRPITGMARRAAQIPLNGEEDLGHTARTDELGQLAGAFNGLVARLRAALQTQRQFMADASHELRTPVSVIRTAAEVALTREHRDEAEYREALAIAGGEARRVGRLVEDMLVLARADAGGYPLRPVDLYLDEVVEECRRSVDVLATARGVTVRAEAPAEIAFRGDEDLLRQLVLNVLQNAVQHTPAGGLVAIDVRQDCQRVSIRVTDAGAGIQPAAQAIIFDRFVQLDPARRGDGTGLGLPIARWIAEAHGGSLVLERSGPGGSVFCVSLPVTGV